MAVRIYIEIGHEASIRTKKTQDGFTHDWEVFVRGVDGAEIHHFIEKVVFYLHETFPKPKRVIKEPPYAIKESGYAGFMLPIDIYLRNTGEPKKIKFHYDLNLQPSGPPLLKVQKEKYVFSNISEDFKMKLLKGGGTIASSANISDNSENRSNIDEKNQMLSKPKLTGNDIIKKPKLKVSDSYNSNFHEVFGSPIIASKSDSKQSIWKDSKNSSKSEKDKGRSKFSPHKESHKDKEKDKTKDKNESEKKSSKDEKKLKERNKDRDRSKDKEKIQKKEKSPSPRRSPKRSPPRLSSPAVVKHKESKPYEKERKDKSEDKKSKKEKRSKEHKEDKRNTDDNKIDDYREKRLEKDNKKDSGKVNKIETPPSPQPPPPPPPKVPEKKEKIKEKKDKEKEPSKEKYKSKKKDKEKRDKKEEKLHRSEKKLEKTEPKPALKPQELPSPAKKKEVERPFLVDEDSSSSSISSSTSSSLIDKKPKNDVIKVKDEKDPKVKKEKGYQDSGIKCKRKSNTPESEEQPPAKIGKTSNVNNNVIVKQEKSLDIFAQDEEEYLSLLKELQLKIMALKDNDDLTKVVQLIAETGRYEVSAHTFDFDLCLLERSTVQQLQEFLSNES